MSAPRLCEIWTVGPFSIARWTPKLGEGPLETKHKGRPRRWHVTLDETWWKPWRWEYVPPRAG